MSFINTLREFRDTVTLPLVEALNDLKLPAKEKQLGRALIDSAIKEPDKWTPVGNAGIPLHRNDLCERGFTTQLQDGSTFTVYQFRNPLDGCICMHRATTAPDRDWTQNAILFNTRTATRIFHALENRFDRPQRVADLAVLKQVRSQLGSVCWTRCAGSVESIGFPVAFMADPNPAVIIFSAQLQDNTQIRLARLETQWGGEPVFNYVMTACRPGQDERRLLLRAFPVSKIWGSLNQVVN